MPAFRTVRLSLFILLLTTVFATVPAAADEIPTSRLHLIPQRTADQAPPATKTPPTGTEIVNPAEFCRADAMIISWTNWHAPELTDMCLAVGKTERILVTVSGPTEQAQAYTALVTAGVNMDNIDFLQTANASVWIRDYGPFCIYDDGQLAITDCDYGMGGDFDAVPIDIADDAGLPWYRSDLMHHGGNHISDGNGTGFFSANLTEFNPGWSLADIEQELSDYMGLEQVVVFGRMDGDMTGHCDMFVKLLNDTLLVVGEYADPGDAVGDDAAFLDDLAASLDGLKNVDGRRFEVRRIPMNPIVSGSYDVNRTYTNSLILNDYVLVPIYDTPLDEPALQVYRDCMPQHTIVGIDCQDVIEYLGAIHCISNTLHDANPLVILHDVVTTADWGDEPVLSCRLNPRFTDRTVQLHYQAVGGTKAVVDAVFSGGVWRAQLPPVSDDFEYWFTAEVTTDAGVMTASLPRTAPDSTYTVDVQGSSPAPLPAVSAVSLTAHPNPFNPRTQFTFALASPATVDLVVYDLAGRLQRRLFDGVDCATGPHEVIWDGGDDQGRALPSGVYLARLSLGADRNTTALTRVVLVR